MNSRISQLRPNLGVRFIGLKGLVAGVSAGDSVTAAGVSVSNTALQRSLRESRCRSMQAVMRSTFGMSEAQSRIASPCTSLAVRSYRPAKLSSACPASTRSRSPICSGRMSKMLLSKISLPSDAPCLRGARVVNRSVASWSRTIGRDGFALFAPQARNGFVARRNCFVVVSSISVS
jgi:hypothetical protein